MTFLDWYLVYHVIFGGLAIFGAIEHDVKFKNVTVGDFVMYFFLANLPVVREIMLIVVFNWSGFSNRVLFKKKG